MGASKYIFKTKVGTITGRFIPVQGDTRASASGTSVYDDNSRNCARLGSDPPLSAKLS